MRISAFSFVTSIQDSGEQRPVRATDQPANDTQETTGTPGRARKGVTMEFPYKGSIVYCKNAAGQWEKVKLQEVQIEDENQVQVQYTIEPITPMTLQLTMKITPEMKARLCGYKNLACYERARRRAKRAKEKHRRRRLKEGK